MNDEASPTAPSAAYDLIGDVHGHAEPLKLLLDLLGYQVIDGAHRHPEGRRVIFLGDFIDRGPAIRETLHLVKAMVDAGSALAVMGNHEYNAVCYHTPDGPHDHLRSHTADKGKNTIQHQATVDAFAGRKEEWDGWIAWFKKLPFSLDLGGLRAVHAAWDHRSIEFLRGKSLADEEFLRASARKDKQEFAAIDRVLKGFEIKLPEGNYFEDEYGLKRTKIRVRWWDDLRGRSYREAVFPDCDTVSEELIHPDSHIFQAQYPETEVPVFFGHYWLPGDAPLCPVAPNIACLDYSVAKSAGRLVAYRWDREVVLDSARFRSVPASGTQGLGKPAHQSLSESTLLC